MTALERMARAISDERADPKGAFSASSLRIEAEERWENKYFRADAFRDARAALNALRETEYPGLLSLGMNELVDAILNETPE